MKKKTLVSVIIPVYNENSTILKLIKKVDSIKIYGFEFQIVIVESNSDDGSKDVVKKFEKKKKFDLIFQSVALGKGSAVIEGLKKSKGDIIIIQDSDLEYDPNDYELMLRPIIKNKTDFVLGSRIKNGAFGIRKFKNQFFISYLYNFSHVLLTFFFNILYKQKLKDPWTCYKVFKKKCIENIKLECLGFDFDMELICKLVKNKIYPVEIPINYTARSFKEGKKVSIIKDGPKSIIAMLKYRLK